MEKRGIVGDIIEVKRGFARNFLIPRKKAGDVVVPVCLFNNILYLPKS
jgi:ribosomal protein L9